MNALTDPPQTLTLLPIGDISPSSTAVQTARRARFNPEHLLELAASIKTLGVQQPIVVRPTPPGLHSNNTSGLVRPYEIVCGERRWLAADRAGLNSVPALIRDLDDEHVLEIQLIENLQREGLHPLEEGEGYRELMRLKKIDAETVGKRVGKSRAYVYSRTKLLDLCAPAREALQTGQLDASKALLLARLQPEKRQIEATRYLLNIRHYSYQAAFNALRERFATRLDTAPFDRDAADYRNKQKEALPACTGCPHNSAHDPELADPDHPGAHVCTDRLCFDQKTAAHWRGVRAAAEAAGKTILTGATATAAIPSRYSDVSATHLRLDAECDAIDFPEPEPKQVDGETEDALEARWDAWSDRRDAWQAPTYRTVLAPHGDLDALTVYAESPDAGLVPLLPLDTARPLLKKAGLRAAEPTQHRLPLTDEDHARAAAERKRDEEKLAIEREYRRQLFITALGKWKPPFTRDELRQIAAAMGTFDEDDRATVFGKTFSVDKAKDADLMRYIIAGLVADDLRVTLYYHDKPTALLALAERTGIDLKAAKAATIAKVRPTAVPQDKPAPPRKAAAQRAKPAAARKAAKK